jgi:hypothetical protein
MLNKIFGMNMNTTFLALSLTVCLGALSSTQAHACASCGCTLNTDWENLNPSSVSGLKFDLRYDYVNQNQLRSGTHIISPVDASQIVHGGDA